MSSGFKLEMSKSNQQREAKGLFSSQAPPNVFLFCGGTSWCRWCRLARRIGAQGLIVCLQNKGVGVIFQASWTDDVERVPEGPRTWFESRFTHNYHSGDLWLCPARYQVLYQCLVHEPDQRNISTGRWGVSLLGGGFWCRPVMPDGCQVCMPKCWYVKIRNMKEKIVPLTENSGQPWPNHTIHEWKRIPVQPLHSQLPTALTSC